MRRLAGASVFDPPVVARCAASCWPAPPRLPASRTCHCLWPGPLHSPSAKQHGDAALDSDPESLYFLECWAALQGFLFCALLAASLRDAHLLDRRLLATLFIIRAVKAAISGVPLGRMLEGLLMTLQRGF